MNLETRILATQPVVLAPDGSEIRVLVNVQGASVCHCTLPAGQTSMAVAHKTVTEVWYFLQGRGQIWRRFGEEEQTVQATPGMCLTIPVGTHFQFRNAGPEPLCFLIATMPPWPGAEEAYRVPDHWTVAQQQSVAD